MLPGKRKDKPWEMLIDTSISANDQSRIDPMTLKPGQRYNLRGRSLVLLIQRFHEA
jgi:hypothetical protein